MIIEESKEGLSYEEYWETDKWKWTMVAGIVTPQLTHHEGEEVSIQVTMNPKMDSFHCRVDSPSCTSSYYWSRGKTNGRWSTCRYSYGVQRGTPELGVKELVHLTEAKKLWEKV